MRACHADNSHIIMTKSGEPNTLYSYSIKKGKTSKLMSLSHEMEGEEWIKEMRCTSVHMLVVTSKNKVILANFIPAVICVYDQICEQINDFQMTENGEIIIVGEYGNISVLRIQGDSDGPRQIEGEVRKWVQKNDLSWLDNSVWVRKKSSIDGDRSSLQLKTSVDSINILKSSKQRGRDESRGEVGRGAGLCEGQSMEVGRGAGLC